MNKILKRLLTGVLTLATVFTALPTTAVHAAETQYWTESEERVGIVEKVMNDGSIGSKGRGYVDTGNSVISEFYTPLVPKGHDFLKEIGRLSQNRQDGQAACSAKAAGTD